MKIVIVDYGAGNLRSVAKAFETVAAASTEILVTAEPKKVAQADRIILPGVGAFGECWRGLNSCPGLVEAMEFAIRKEGRPFLGICVGMQLMASAGLEFGRTPGLDWISGIVGPLNPSDKNLRLPHMGWNDLYLHNKGHPVLSGIRDGDPVYFVHSFSFYAENMSHVMAHTDYGGNVTAAIGRDNLFGVQFHPEKSQAIGLRLLENFLNWRP